MFHSCFSSNETESLNKKITCVATVTSVPYIHPDSTQDVRRDETGEQGIFHEGLTRGDTQSAEGNDVLLSEEM
jgi:hypothetical protein